MTFRTRLTVATAAAVAAAMIAVCVAVYFAARASMRGEVDRTLLERSRAVVRVIRPGQEVVAAPDVISRLPVAAPLGQTGVYTQIVEFDGTVVRPSEQEGPALPPDEVALAVANGRRDSPVLQDRRLQDSRLRVMTLAGPGNTALQVARSLDEVDGALRRLMLILSVLCGGGIALAGGAGFAITRAAVGPVTRLTETTERVAETGDLSHRIEGPDSGDEISRLAHSFNSMLDALQRSVGAQRRLVSDASHELRTPLTSVRTNIEVLARQTGMSEEERSRLLRDVTGQLEELSVLVSDLVEVARAPAGPSAVETVALDDLAASCVESARRRFPSTEIAIFSEPVVVRGVAARIERAIAAVIDNAVKYGGGRRIEVEVARGRVSIRDRGPGFADADLPRVFDGFYRSDASRGTPGSGLGLAIAREVAAEHGGMATASNRPGGGAEVTLSFRPRS